MLGALHSLGTNFKSQTKEIELSKGNGDVLLVQVMDKTPNNQRDQRYQDSAWEYDGLRSPNATQMVWPKPVDE